MTRRNNDERQGANLTGDGSPAAAGTMPAHLKSDVPGSLSFVVPTEFVELPSKGRYYGEGHPLHNEETIEIRHMTAKDEDILSSRALLKKGLAIDRLLSSIIVNKQIDPGALLVGDKNAIIVAARISAYTSEYTTRVSCPTCGASGDYTFDLSQVDLNYGEDHKELDISQNDEGDYVITLPVTKAEVATRFLTGVDEKKMLNALEAQRKTNRVTNTITMNMKMFIKSVNGVTKRHELDNFINNMPTLDSQYLRTAYNQIVPNVDMVQHYNCSECASESTLEVPFTADFFWPR
jgi:hypothetical protein